MKKVENYSVLMSLYKKENPDNLKLAIDSMINQTIKPNEIILVEDGPLTTELYDVLNIYKDKYNDLLKIIKSKENIGLGLALNLGLKNCKNELVARMDTDDYSLPNRCEKQLEAFEKDKELDIVGCAIMRFKDNINETTASTSKVLTDTKDIYEYTKRRSPFCHPSVMFKKITVLKCGGYRDLRRNQDIDLFGRLMYSGAKATNLSDSLICFRTNNDLAKRKKSWLNSQSYIKTIYRFYKMGYSSFSDYLIVLIAQTVIFIIPIWMQKLIYKYLLKR